MLIENRANSSNRATPQDVVERRPRRLVFSFLTGALVLAILIAPFVSVEIGLAADAVGDDPCLTCPLGANTSAAMAANPELMAARRFAASRDAGRAMSGTFRDLAANPELMAVRRFAPTGKAPLHPDMVHGLVGPIANPEPMPVRLVNADR
jgi:hypothetical protein